MKNYMIDIETLGTRVGSVITQIGACEFNIETGEIGDRFLVNIDPVSCERKGMLLDADTVCWWMHQKVNTWHGAEKKKHIFHAMDEFCNFIVMADRVWSHATFDFVMLENASRMLGLSRFPKFRKSSDIRTLLDLCRQLTGVDVIQEVPKNEFQHDALADCIHQSKYCAMAYRLIKESGGSR